MSNGLFSRIEAEKYLKNQSSFIDVINAACIDRSIGIRQVNAVEEIGHAGARQVTSKGLSSFFELFFRIILSLIYALSIGFNKLHIIKYFFYSIGILLIVLLPACVFFLFYSEETHYTVLLCSILILYITHKIRQRKIFIISILSFFISLFLTLDIHYLHIIYTPIETYKGIWVSSHKHFLRVNENPNTGKKILSWNIKKSKEGSVYYNIFGYNFIYIYDKNNPQNTLFFMFLNEKLIFEPFFGKHEILNKI